MARDERESDGGHVLPEDDFVFIAMEKIGHGFASGGDDGVGAAAGGEGAAGIRV